MKLRRSLTACLIPLLSLAAPPALADDRGTNVVISSCIAETTYKATAKVVGWLPTSVATGFEPTPNAYVIGTMKTYKTNYVYNGVTPISVAAVAAMASSTYVANFLPVTTFSQAWEWYQEAPTPGLDAQMVIMHRSDKITFTKYQNNANCTTTTTTGLVIYLPVDSNSQATYCSILDVYPAKNGWSSTCTD